MFDVRAVFQQAHPDLAIGAMPPLLLPPKGRYGLRDYEKVFCPDLNEWQGYRQVDLKVVDLQAGAEAKLA